MLEIRRDCRSEGRASRARLDERLDGRAFAADDIVGD